MRKAVLALAILLVLVVGSDIAVGSVVESRLAAVAQRRLGLPERPSVDLDGFPFVFYALQRRFPAASMETRDMRIEGLAMDRAVLELQDVRFDSFAAVGGGSGTLTANRGIGAVEVTQDSLVAYLKRQGIPFHVELSSREVTVSRKVRLDGQVLSVSARGTLAVSEEALEFTPEEIEGDGGFEFSRAVSFRVDLPEVFPGVAYRDVTVTEGLATLSFRFSRTTIPL